jgi:hypothetical protein
LVSQLQEVNARADKVVEGILEAFPGSSIINRSEVESRVPLAAGYPSEPLKGDKRQQRDHQARQESHASYGLG